MNKQIISVAVLLCVFFHTLCEETVSAGEPTAAEQLFALKVQPLFREKCLGCHGEKPDELESGFDIRSRAAVLRGGDSFGEDVLVLGEPSKSALYAMVQREEPDFEMPPKETDKLTQEEIWWIRDWIEGGAPWPDENRVAEIYEKYAEGITWKTSGGLSDEWTSRKYKPEDLWAYQPLRKDDTSRLENGKRNPIDILLEDQLQQAKITPAASTDRRTLIRRATFDLLGLPPDPDDVESFVNDSRSDEIVYADWIEHLLQSPHYGEQWGRHWLDVVRYADSSGFSNDWERPNAWRYRDYVIRAFNEDKPYNQFISEQIAGDELGPDDAESQIAAGFLRMGAWEHTSMSVAKVTRQQFLDDITDSVGQVFLAHALQCCRCHDHKFDPIPTRDYYSIQAVFATTQFAEEDAEWLPQENLAGMDEEKQYHQQRLESNKQLVARLNAIKNKNHRKWFQQKGLPYKTRNEAVKDKVPEEQLPPKNAFETPDEFGQQRIGSKWQRRFFWEQDRYRPIAYTVFSGKTHFLVDASRRLRHPTEDDPKAFLEKTAILKGGNVFSPSEPVSPGVLSAVTRATNAEIPGQITGRRTAFANWLASPQNTLTARVMVNRIWQYHFGRGIAGNPNNFGATGKKPTHPELLDWLATEFIKNSWSVKHMHRLIMTSDAYQRASTHPKIEALRDLDPTGDLYAVFQPRRLVAEEFRDAMLAVSGELNREMGGIPIRPDMNLEAALQPRMIMGTFAPSYVPNPQPGQRNRRSVYALKLRGHRDPFMETFNQPGSEKSCEFRDSSTITPQALTLFNSAETGDRALAFADQVIRETNSDQAALELVFQRAYGRMPSATELAEGLAFWSEMSQVQSKIEYQSQAMPTTVVRQAVDENTGKPFTFTEKLFAYEDYVADLSPNQVDAQTRGLADLCLAILNSNEFAFIY